MRPLPRARLFLRKALTALTIMFGFALGSTVLEAQSTTEEKPASGREFIRFFEESPSRGDLKTSVRRYRHDETGRVVALVSAVHVADRAYFRDLQAELDRYDLVLFERVGTEDEIRENPKESGLGFFALLQLELTRLFSFQYQLDGIDYERRNFRHADMSLEEFSRRSGMPVGPASGAGEEDELMSFFAPILQMGFAFVRTLLEMDPQVLDQMRMQFARVLGDMDAAMEQMNSAGMAFDPDDVILGARNDHVWKVLEETLPERHQRIAIFYGAAHMPDFDQRLRAEGWKLDSQEWIRAWQIPAPKPGDPLPRPASKGVDL